jgi:hypothetical protein
MSRIPLVTESYCFIVARMISLWVGKMSFITLAVRTDKEKRMKPRCLTDGNICGRNVRDLGTRPSVHSSARAPHWWTHLQVTYL